MSDYDPDEDLTDEELAAAWDRGVPVELVAFDPSDLVVPAADTHMAGARAVVVRQPGPAASPSRSDTGQTQTA
jgi:hypothetical protein